MELRAEIYALKAEFMKRATLDRIDRERLSEEMRKRIARERKEEIEDRRNAEVFVAMMATPVQLQEFTVKLDRYDTATVEALMENGDKLQEVRKQLTRCCWRPMSCLTADESSALAMESMCLMKSVRRSAQT